MTFLRSSTAMTVLLLIPIFCGSVRAQERSRTVAARDVETASYELTGDSAAWPVLVQIAQRDAERNAFVLDREGLRTIASFGTGHRSVLRAEADLRRFVAGGARIFASEELGQATRLLDRYRQAVRSADVPAAQELNASVVSAIARVGTAVDERRTEDIMAALVSKAGTVDKRKGLLGRWSDAQVNDMFAPTDAVRTAEESQAGLTFSDGVDVVVGERTTVVIRESRIDKLNQRIRRDVDLVTGSVLAKLTAAARDGGELTMRAGPAQSNVRSGRFWVEAAQRREMRLSNYDGSIAVVANNVEVRLERNQGTVAREGQAPMKPVDLLAAPAIAWSGTDTVVGTDRFELTWGPVSGAEMYVIETSTSRTFDGTIERRTVRNRSAALTSLPLGTTYIRTAAIDRSGLRGIESGVYSLTRIEDRQPPAVLLSTGDATTQVTAKRRFTITGTTERDASVSVNGTRVAVGPDGTFATPIDILENTTPVRVEALDVAGNLTTRSLTLVRPDPALLERITWSAAIDGRVIRPSGDRLVLRGTAYPGVEVRFTNGTTDQTVRTAPDGRWVLTVNGPAPGNWTLTMVLRSEDATIYSETYEIR